MSNYPQITLEGTVEALSHFLDYGNKTVKYKRGKIMNVLKTTIMIAIAIITFSDPALAGISQTAWDFEQGSGASSNNGISGWFFTGGAGLDNGKGLAYKGKGNAWVRYTKGWNAINNLVSISVPQGSECTASAWLRTSDTLTDGYMAVRDGSRSDGSGTILNETKLVGARPPGNGNVNGYRLESFNFRMGSSGKVLFYVGLHGIGKDAWIQIDNAAITCKTPPF